MACEILAARAHPAVVVSVVIAAVAVTACALVAIAYMMGWIPSQAAAPGPMSVAIPGSQVAGSAPDVALLPGEALVEPPAATPAAPAAPPAAAPKPSYPSPAAPYAPPASRSGSTAPTYAPSNPPPRPAPRTPAYSRAEPPPMASRDRASKSLCINCGTIAAIANPSGEWEVRVRFEDGTSETLRYPERPRLRVGDKVYVENGRLIPE